MFWRKGKSSQLKDVNHLKQLAQQLGVERRLNPRMKLPDINGFVSLPSVFYGDQFMRVHDLSVGGCCLLDPKEVMGPRIGEELSLTLRWLNGEDSVRARIVARITHKRHIQFLDLPGARAEEIKVLIQPAVRGLNMRIAEPSTSEQLEVKAGEIWISFQGDSIVFDAENHRKAEISLLGETYQILNDSWPTKKNDSPLSPREFEAMILFLTNIPNPSADLIYLLARLLRLSTARPK